MKRTFLYLLLSAAFVGAKAQEINIIPQPVSIVKGKGVCANPHKISVQKTAGDSTKAAYSLDITKKGIVVNASNHEARCHALTTLKQLQEQFGQELPVMKITDAPRYEWRGMMLDVSRHFYTLEYLKKQVDMLAYYKMNRLHLHLTDDQGWRMEIKRYPELTQQGAWREFNQQDSICIAEYKDMPEWELDPRFIVKHGEKTLYGGYYTQEQLRSLVAYAHERGVEIIPEIDMPGHTQAISAIHPEFTASGEAKWGTTFSYPLSPAKEEVYAYMQNILDEVIDVFPSKYIHIGADEVEKTTWKESEECRLLMEREGIKTYEDLQSYFVKRMQAYLKSKGREMICWDDALEGELDPQTDIMYWRYWVGGVPKEAVERGHHVIFTPGHPMYIARTTVSLYDIYHYDGFDKIDDAHQHLVRGGQVSLWAEGMSNFRRADVSIYPRMLALAELLWTPKTQKNWRSFKRRLDAEKKHLEREDIVCGKTLANLSSTQTTDLQNKKILVAFDSEFSDPDIRYTLDGTMPTMSSAKYDDMPLEVTSPVDMKAAIMIDGKPSLPVFSRQLEFHKGVGAKVEYLSGKWYESYKAAEMATFTDGKRAQTDGYSDGMWQGFMSSFEVLIDLGEAKELSSFTMRFLQDAGAGVFMPGKLEVAVGESKDALGQTITIDNDIAKDKMGVMVKDFNANIGNGGATAKVRYIKVKAHNVSGGFIFADEVVLN